MHICIFTYIYLYTYMYTRHAPRARARLHTHIHVTYIYYVSNRESLPFLFYVRRNIQLSFHWTDKVSRNNRMHHLLIFQALEKRA